MAAARAISDDDAREYMDLRLSEFEKRYQERERAREEAIKTALVAADERFAALNEWRKSYGDLAALGMRRSEVEALVASLSARIDGETGPIATRIGRLEQTNWPLVGTFISLALVATTGIWMIIGLKIESMNIPLQISEHTQLVATEQHEARIHAAETAIVAGNAVDAVSIADRKVITERVQNLEHLLRENSDRIGRLMETNNNATTELRTQVIGLGAVMNIHLDQEQQWETLLFEKIFPGQRMPQSNFRPGPTK